MAGCEYQIEGSDKIYSESEFKKLLSEGYLDKVMMDKGIKIKGIKADEALASSFQIPSAIQPQAPTEVKSDYQIAQEATNEVSKENPDASVLLTPKGEDLSLTAVYVAKENRGKGIGTKVLESVKKQADKLGKKVVLDATTELDEETDLGRLESFYEKNGFTKVGDNKFEYNPTAEVTETVTPEVKEEIGASKKIEELLPKPEKPIDKTKKGIFGKKDRTYKKRLLQYEDDLDDWNKSIKFFNNNPDAVEFYENANEEQKKYILRYSIWKSNSKDLDLNQLSEYRFIQDDGTFLISSKGFTMKINDYENAPKLKDGKLDFDKVKYDVVNPKGEVIYSSSNYDNAESSLYEENSKYQLQKSKVSIPTETVTKTEEVLTEPTTETKVEEQVTEPTAKKQRLQISTPLTENEQRVAARGEGVNQLYVIQDALQKNKKYKTKKVSQYEIALSKGETTYSEVKEAIESAGIKVPDYIEKFNPENKKQPTREAVAAKNLADFLRRGKSEKGTAMVSPLPGFNQVWDATIETVAKAIEVGGVTAGNFRQSIEAGMKAFKKTDTYKAITDPKERAKISAQYKKALVDLVPKHYNFNTDDLRNAEFETFNQKLEESKGKTLSTKEFNAIKSEAKKFVNDNLPADKYRKSEVQSYVRNNFDKAKTVEDIQNNLDKVNNIIATKEAKIETAEAKQTEKDRQSTIKEIMNLTKPGSSKMISKNKRTGAKKGNISLDAQRQINDMRSRGMFDNETLQGKTLEELNQLKEQIKNIQTEGRAEKKLETATKKEVKKSGEAIILQALDKENKVLDSKEQIIDFMEKYNGVVVVDGQVMSKSSFKDYAKKNPDADYTGTKFYVEKGTELKEQKEEKKGVVRAARELTMGAIRDLDTYMKDISRGSKELRDWTKKNILEPTKVAIYNKVKNTSKLKKEYRNEVEKIFGGFYSAINYLSKDSGISTDVSELQGVKPKKINRDQAVHIYGLINNPDTEKAQKNIDRLKSKNHIDTDKIKALVEGDPKLMAYYEFLKDKYNNQFRKEFGPTIENLYGIPLDEGYYWPEPAGTSEKLELNLEGFQNKDISMIAPNMRQREPGYDGAFELVNSYDMYNRYVESMTHAKEFIPVIENSRTLLSDVNRPRILEKLNDTNKYNDLVELMKVIYTDKTPFNNTKMDLLANVTAVKSLWFRLKAIPQQASAFMNYYNAGWVDGINPFQIINSVVPKNSTELDFALDFYRDNPYLWQRFKGASNQDMKAIEASVDSIVNEYGKKFINAGLFAALSPIKAGDFLATSTPLGGGAFAMAQFKNKLKENGGNYQEAKDFALRRWFEETERTQQPAIDKSIVSTVTYDPKYRFFLPFISAQNSMGKKVVKAVKDIQDWKNLTGEEQTQAVADMMYYTLIGSIPFTLMSGSLLTVKDVFDEEDEEARGNMFERISFDLLADNVMSQLQSLSYIGLITNMVLNEMRGREFFNNRPQGETIDSFVGFLSSMVMASSNWDFLSEEMKKDYFARFKLKGKELEEFNALSEEEKIDYLTKNAVKTGFISNESGSMEKFKEEFAKQSRFNRMGKKGMDSFLKATGIDKPMNLYRDVKNYINENGTLGQLVYGEGAGTVVSAPPFSENIPKQFFDAINYGKDNQLFKYYSNLVSGKPEEYYEIYPSKPGGPISKPVTAPNLDQSKPAAGRIRVKRKRPSGGRVMINEE